ncbi:MAG: hypothetical protein AVDCRST_MAG91-3863, partial [uncultured Sphingomonadaceae bacterium]
GRTKHISRIYFLDFRYSSGSICDALRSEPAADLRRTHGR